MTHLVSDWQQRLKQQYESEVRSKHVELETHQKNNIKNSVRLCMQDLANVYFKYGYTG